MGNICRLHVWCRRQCHLSVVCQLDGQRCGFFVSRLFLLRNQSPIDGKLIGLGHLVTLHFSRFLCYVIDSEENRERFCRINDIPMNVDNRLFYENLCVSMICRYLTDAKLLNTNQTCCENAYGACRILAIMNEIIAFIPRIKIIVVQYAM